MVMQNTQVDLFIIGGGINGAGIAADAALRGFSVVLCEKDDLAAHTSSWSSKLIHGGLRYLEHYEFRLVRKALKERETLLNLAPHLIHPLRFIMPLSQYARPMWLLRLGLFIYDHLDMQQSLPKSNRWSLLKKGWTNPFCQQIKKALTYFDAQVDDARLVIANAKQAQKYGASILVHHEVISASHHEDHWQIVVHDTKQGKERVFTAKAVVNAAGPWVDDILRRVTKHASPAHVRLVKGSHIVVRRRVNGDEAYILQHKDKRIVFVIPFQEAFSLIGTTDVAFSGDRGQPMIEQAEIDYLIDIVNQYFAEPIAQQDIVWQYSGVRPLFDSGEANPSQLTRDYVLQVDSDGTRCPMVSVFGGKITTYRVLAEAVMTKLSPFFASMPKSKTAQKPLPGGDLGGLNFHDYLQRMQKQYHFLDAAFVRRLVLAYGAQIKQVLQGVNKPEDLGQHFGGTLYAKEVRYLMDNEWASSVDDILWRRTKQGLHLNVDQQHALATHVLQWG